MRAMDHDAGKCRARRLTIGNLYFFIRRITQRPPDDFWDRQPFQTCAPVHVVKDAPRHCQGHDDGLIETIKRGAPGSIRHVINP